MLIRYVEGIDSERGLERRCANFCVRALASWCWIATGAASIDRFVSDWPERAMRLRRQLNEEVILILENAAKKLSEVAWGMGEAASFDPNEFVASRLAHLEKQGRLRGRDPWWLEDSP